MADTIFKYPLDLDGTSKTNEVLDEAHTIGTTVGRIFASDYGPFFGNSVVVKDAVTGKELKPVDDYVLVHHYKEAADRTGQAVYAAVWIKNPAVSTKVLFTAQVVGGEFSFSTYAIKQMLEALRLDNRPVYWGDILGIPSQFNPAPHLHSAYDLYGLKYVVESNYEIAAAIRDGDAASRSLFFQQAQAKFDTFDDFALQVASCFSDAAEELSKL